jgi:hypothetical protein
MLLKQVEVILKLLNRYYLFHERKKQFNKLYLIYIFNLYLHIYLSFTNFNNNFQFLIWQQIYKFNIIV